MIALIGLSMLPYLIPDTGQYIFDINLIGTRQFEQILFHQSLPRLNLGSYIFLLRILTCLAWIGYAAALISMERGNATARGILPIVVGLAVFFAVICPPLLSSDIYASVGFARMGVIHGANPYMHSLDGLARQGDPAARVYPTVFPTNYGAVWTLVTYAIIGLLRAGGVWLQVVGVKLLMGLALVSMAIAGKRIADYLSPGRGDIAFVAIGFNPLLIIEGPGNGHNDLLMMALMLWAVVYFLRERYALCYALLGLSAGVKYVTVALLSWLVIEEARRHPQWMRRLGVGLRAIGITLGVIVLAFAQFWNGPSTLWSIGSVYVQQTSRHAPPHRSQAPLDVRSGATAKTTIQPKTASLVSHQWPVLALYTALVLAFGWNWASKKHLLMAWATFSLLLFFWSMPFTFGWYFAWPLCGTLTGWDRIQVRQSIACLIVAFLLMFRYSLPASPSPGNPSSAVPAQTHLLLAAHGR